MAAYCVESVFNWKLNPLQESILLIQPILEVEVLTGHFTLKLQLCIMDIS
jgi:hypothetical protein